MSFSYVDHTNGSGSQGANANRTIAKPASTADGDLLLAIFAWNAAASTTTTRPSGWNSVQYLNSNNQIIQVDYKVASGEPSSWSWQWNKFCDGAFGVQCFRGGNFTTGGGIVASAVNNQFGTGGATITWPSLSWATTTDVVSILYTSLQPPPGYATSILPSGYSVTLIANDDSQQSAVGLGHASNNTTWTVNSGATSLSSQSGTLKTSAGGTYSGLWASIQIAVNVSSGATFNPLLGEGADQLFPLVNTSQAVQRSSNF